MNKSLLTILTVGAVIAGLYVNSQSEAMPPIPPAFNCPQNTTYRATYQNINFCMDAKACPAAGQHYNEPYVCVHAPSVWDPGEYSCCTGPGAQ